MTQLKSRLRSIEAEICEIFAPHGFRLAAKTIRPRSFSFRFENGPRYILFTGSAEPLDYPYCLNVLGGVGEYDYRQSRVKALWQVVREREHNHYAEYDFDLIYEDSFLGLLRSDIERYIAYLW